MAEDPARDDHRVGIPDLDGGVTAFQQPGEIRWVHVRSAGDLAWPAARGAEGVRFIPDFPLRDEGSIHPIEMPGQHPRRICREVADVPVIAVSASGLRALRPPLRLSASPRLIGKKPQNLEIALVCELDDLVVGSERGASGSLRNGFTSENF
jgi:hypothetical protein